MDSSGWIGGVLVSLQMYMTETVGDENVMPVAG